MLKNGDWNTLKIEEKEQKKQFCTVEKEIVLSLKDMSLSSILKGRVW